MHHFEILPPSFHKMKFLIYFIFTLFVLLASSKIGIICLIIVLGFLLFEALQRKYPFWITLFILLGGLILMVSIVYMIEPVRNRFLNVIQNMEQPLDKSSTESNMVRRLVWIADENVVERMPWYGYGVANVNKVLSKEYEELDFTGAKQRNLNAHNQYYQTLIGLGWLGLLVLILIHLDLLFYGILQRKRVWLYILLIMVLNFLVESMLQRAAGSIYFSFITILLCLEKKIGVTSN
jgi:O-antigen ligase